ncbi:hypothetical protein CTEN210_04112 [Chaetoceros tenuissimus]|uniref:Uncharacterized protein n=1 Tax=Chaetoceros tenuissimus TaxID=426638 RepID=A0AAD3CK98_9STRA|nr:hypothetical protein CTEN210_04112 [Chaetoceros tenuissimus]
MSANKRLKVSHTSDRGRGEEVPSASISDLPNDILKHCFSFIPGQYITVAPVSRHFHRNYCTIGMDDSLNALSTDILLQIGKNRSTTVDAVSDDIKLTEYCFIKNTPKEFMIKVCQIAAMKGRTDIIECANVFGIDLIQLVQNKMRNHSTLIEKLVEEGNLEMIQYFDSKLLEDFHPSFWRTLFSRAAVSNHLHIMKWICKEKCQNADRIIDYRKSMKSSIEAYVVVLEGVTASDVTVELCMKAVKHGNIPVLEHCHRNNFRFATITWLCNSSMENKDKEQALVTLKWLRQHGCDWDESLCEAAVSYDNLGALKWARSEGCPWDAGTLCAAAKHGNIAVVEYCLQTQCPMTASICSYAMLNNDHDRALAILKLLRQNLCPWDVGTVDQAIYNGNFEAMVWAKKNGCPWRINSFALLTQRGNVSQIEEVLQYEQLHGSMLFVQTEGIVKMTPDVVRTINSVIFVRRSNDDSDDCIIEKLKVLRRYGYEWNDGHEH